MLYQCSPATCTKCPSLNHSILGGVELSGWLILEGVSTLQATNTVSPGPTVSVLELIRTRGRPKTRTSKGCSVIRTPVSEYTAHFSSPTNKQTIIKHILRHAQLEIGFDFGSISVPFRFHFGSISVHLSKQTYSFGYCVTLMLTFSWHTNNMNRFMQGELEHFRTVDEYENGLHSNFGK